MSCSTSLGNWSCTCPSCCAPSGGPAPELPHIGAYTTTTPEPGNRKLTVRDGDQVVAEATIGTPVAGIGVLWWISVTEAAQSRGIGRALLGSALDLLAGLGAREVILYVDDGEPGGGRDRAGHASTAGNRITAIGSERLGDLGDHIG